MGYLKEFIVSIYSSSSTDYVVWLKSHIKDIGSFRVFKDFLTK